MGNENSQINEKKVVFNLDKVWGFDSEFITEKNKQEAKMLQFFGSRNRKIVCRTRDDVVEFFTNKQPKHIFAFNLACELGSLELLGFKRKRWHENYDWKEFHLGSQLRASLTCKWKGSYDENKHRLKINFYDIQQLAKQLGLWNLNAIGEFLVKRKVLKYSKLPDDRNPTCASCPFFKKCLSNEVENNPKYDCEEYAVYDSVIVYKFIKWMHQNWGYSHKIVSSGTLAQEYLHLPKRLPKQKFTYMKDGKEKTISKCVLTEDEQRISESMFAGRSDAFMNGFFDYLAYLDVKSLYPFSILSSNALMITGVEECSRKEINLSDDLANRNFGWIFGKFECKDEKWGIPFRHNERNYYINGKGIIGIYNTMDLVAGRTKILKAYQCWKPVFSRKEEYKNRHKKYEKLFFDKLRGNLSPVMEKYYKAILNALSGKLGQKKPFLSPRTNFPAYSTLLAHSHLTMAKLFRIFNQVAYIDTDSIFTPDKETGQFELVDDKYPLILETKAEGKIGIIRAKMYRWLDKKTWKFDAFHSWKYRPFEYSTLIQQIYETGRIPNRYKVTMQKVATANTKEKIMKHIPLGYFWEEHDTITDAKAKLLFYADTKRQRKSYKSLTLIARKESSTSTPHDLKTMPSDITEQIKFMEFARAFFKMRKFNKDTPPEKIPRYKNAVIEDLVI